MYHQYVFEDTKGVIRIRISKRNRQHNGQKEKVQKDKQRSTKHTYETKDRVTRNPANEVNPAISVKVPTNYNVKRYTIMSTPSPHTHFYNDRKRSFMQAAYFLSTLYVYTIELRSGVLIV